MVPLTIIHLIGVALGLGVATGLYLLLISLIAKNAYIKADQFRLIKSLSTLVVFGLVLLWISGFGFLLEYQLFEPEKLHNTKLQTKIIIVILLTVNSLIIHFFFLNTLKACIAKKIFTHLSSNFPSLIFVCGAVSFASWYAAFFCGAVPLLNNLLTLKQFMLCYLSILLFFACCSLVFLRILYYKHRLIVAKHPTLKLQIQDF